MLYYLRIIVITITLKIAKIFVQVLGEAIVERFGLFTYIK